MFVERIGDGNPEVSVVACLHGNEPSGKEAIDRTLSANHEFHEPVQFVVANEEAMTEDSRTVDSDLNRAFPGNPTADTHEKRLAPEVLKQVRDTKVLDIHATNSTKQPFAITTRFTMETVHLARATGLGILVDTTGVPDSDGGLISNCSGVSVECGHKNQPETVDTAHEVILNFLAANGVLDREFDYPADPQVYRIFEKIEYPTEDSELAATDFELVRKGDHYLTVEGTEVAATQDFYPVLASDQENSYSFVGFKSKNTGTASDRLHRRQR
jgi:predicted deacylase